MSDGFIASIIHEYLYEGDEPIADYKMSGSSDKLLAAHGAFAKLVQQ